MGMDILLYVEVDVSPERLNAAEEYFVQATNIGDRYNGHVLTLMDKTEYDWFPATRVEVQSLSRYYSPYYARGPWPEIRKAIEALQHLFPEGQVFYGSDSHPDDIGQLVTNELLAELQGHWDLHEHDEVEDG